MHKFLEMKFDNVLDIGAGTLQHTEVFLNNEKIVDICDYEIVFITIKEFNLLNLKFKLNTLEILMK